MRIGTAAALFFAFVAFPMVLVEMFGILDETSTLPTGVQPLFDRLPMIWMSVGGFALIMTTIGFMVWFWARR